MLRITTLFCIIIVVLVTMIVGITVRTATIAPTEMVIAIVTTVVIGLSMIGQQL